MRIAFPGMRMPVPGMRTALSGMRSPAPGMRSPTAGMRHLNAVSHTPRRGHVFPSMKVPLHQADARINFRKTGKDALTAANSSE